MEKVSSNRPVESIIMETKAASADRKASSPRIPDSLTSMQPASSSCAKKLLKKLQELVAQWIRWITCGAFFQKKISKVENPVHIEGNQTPEVQEDIERKKEPMIALRELEPVGKAAIGYLVGFLTSEESEFRKWVNAGKKFTFAFEIKLEPLHCNQRDKKTLLEVETIPSGIGHGPFKQFIEFTIGILEYDWHTGVCDNRKFNLNLLSAVNPEIPKLALNITLKMQEDDIEYSARAFTTIHLNTETAIWKEGMDEYFYKVAAMERSPGSFPVSSFYKPS